MKITMNQIFSFKRFVWLLKRQWMENSAFYLFTMGIIAVAIPVIQWSFIITSMDDKRLNMGQESTFVFSLFFLCGYAAHYFNQSLGSKNKQMFSFSLPVSPLEQVLVAFTFVVALVPAFVLTVFCVYDYLFVQLLNDMHKASEQMLMFKSTSTKWGVVNYFIVHLVNLFAIIPIFALCSYLLKNRGLFISISLYLITMFSYEKWLRYPISCLFETVICVLLIQAFCWTLMYFGMKNKEVVR
jgi:hypothetical protein